MSDPANAPTPGRWRPAEVFREFLDDMNEFWRSPEGQRLQAARQAEEADLQAWLTGQPNVAVHCHGGYAPEQWKGEVDGHSFRFRERDTEWDIEIDLYASGGTVRVADDTRDDGTRYRHDEIIDGEVIATGSTSAQGYGVTSEERAAFIVATIREHLAGRACTHPGLDAIGVALGAPARWCPDCGTRVHGATGTVDGDVR